MALCDCFYFFDSRCCCSVAVLLLVVISVAVGGRCVAVAVGGLQVKLEEQTKKIEDLEEALHGAQTEIKRLEMEVDSAVREKVSSATTTTAVDDRTVMERPQLGCS